MQFQYVTKTGQLKTFDAPDANSANQMTSSFSDADPRSGVMSITTTPPPTLAGTLSGTSVSPSGTADTTVTAPVATVPQPSPTTTPTPTMPSIAQGGPYDITGTVLGKAMSEIQSKLGVNDDLTKQKAMLLKQLYDKPLTPQERSTLSPSQQTAIRGNNRNLIDTELRLINDEISGRRTTLDSAIQYTTGLYTKEQDRIDQQKKEATDLILNFIGTYGSNAPQALRAIYGDDRVAELKKLGIDVDAMASIGLPKTVDQARYDAQYGTGGIGSPTIQLPEGTIAFRTNNPLNIKFSPTMAGFGATDSGIAGQDGGTFSAFGSPEEGLEAAVKLLKSGTYSNLSVDQAMKKWSNNGYGAEVSPSAASDTKISQLDDDQLMRLVSDMAKRESGATVEFPQTDDQLNGQSLVDGSLIPSQLAFNARAKALAAAKRIDPSYNAQDAQLKFEAAKRWITGMNSQRMIQYQGLATSVVNTIDEVKSLAEEVKNSGVIPLNKAKMAAYINLKGNTPEGQLASRYMAAVNTLKEEFANLANGGYAPTESAWALANSQINGDYGVDQLTSTLGEIQRLVNFRIQAIGNTTPVYPGSNNFGGTGTGAETGTNDPLGIL